MFQNGCSFFQRKSSAESSQLSQDMDEKISYSHLWVGLLWLHAWQFEPVGLEKLGAAIARLNTACTVGSFKAGLLDQGSECDYPLIEIYATLGNLHAHHHPVTSFALRKDSGLLVQSFCQGCGAFWSGLYQGFPIPESSSRYYWL